MVMPSLQQRVMMIWSMKKLWWVRLLGFSLYTKSCCPWYRKSITCFHMN